MDRALAQRWQDAIAHGQPDRLEELMTGALKEAPVFLKAPFYLASLTHRSTELFSLLAVHFSPQVNEAGVDGRTALWVVLGSGNVRAAEVLLSHGADPNGPSRAGLLPWEYMLGQGMNRLVAPFERAGANWALRPMVAWERAWEGGDVNTGWGLMQCKIGIPEGEPGRAWQDRAWQARPHWHPLLRCIHAQSRQASLAGRLPPSDPGAEERPRF